MRIFKLLSVLFFFLALISVQVFSQDILFKKDSSIVKVNIIDFDGKSITYKIPGESPDRIYYLSKSILDSLKWKSIDFTFASGIREPEPRQISRNSLNVEIVNTLAGMLNLNYERLFKTGRVGFVAGLLINTNSYKLHPLERMTYSPFYFSGRVEINWYPFNNSLVKHSNFRFLTGWSILMSSYKYQDIYYYPYIVKQGFAKSLLWNIEEKVYLGDHFQVSGGVELSIIPFLAFVCPQIGISIGF